MALVDGRGVQIEAGSLRDDSAPHPHNVECSARDAGLISPDSEEIEVWRHRGRAGILVYVIPL